MLLLAIVWAGVWLRSSVISDGVQFAAHQRLMVYIRTCPGQVRLSLGELDPRLSNVSSLTSVAQPGWSITRADPKEAVHDFWPFWTRSEQGWLLSSGSLRVSGTWIDMGIPLRLPSIVLALVSGLLIVLPSRRRSEIKITKTAVD